MPPGWDVMDDSTYGRVWDRFYEQFQFRPGMSSRTWPAITEPSPSLTLDLSPIYQGGSSVFPAGEEAVTAQALWSFISAFPEDERLLALDWQHNSYFFWPHVHAAASGLAIVDRTAEWPIYPFPNGDYYIFLSEDFTTGTFGHPWERTLCVFGDRLVQSLGGPLSAWLPVKRTVPHP